MADYNNLLEDSQPKLMDADAMRQVVSQLNSAGLGYSDPGDIGMHVLAGYHPLGRETVKRLAGAGQVLHGMLDKTAIFYKRAILEKDRELLEILETGILRIPQIREFHRELFLSGRRMSPVIFRGDSPDGVQFSEFHAGLRGLGYIWALRQITEKAYGPCAPLSFKRVRELLCGFRDWALSDPAAACSDKNGRSCAPEMDYLFRELFGDSLLRMQRGKRDYRNLERFMLLLISPRRMFHGWQSFLCKNAFKWTPFLQKIIFNEWFEVMQKYRKGAIDVEPPPNLFFEQKTIMALPWHPRYKGCFTEEERKLFPETHIIREGEVFGFGQDCRCAEDIVSLPRSRRAFIIKYAGLNMPVNYGGKQVYRLKNISKQSVRRIFMRAIRSYEEYREPWIIQKDISQQQPVRFFNTTDDRMQNKNMYTLYRPYYLALPNAKGTELIDILVFFRDFFKVHAVRESIFGTVNVKDDE